MSRTLPILTVALLLALAGTVPATAAGRFSIRGAGYGHGVGMSQYGAMGYASHGWSYQRILGHYYSGTALSVLKEPREVRVLLASSSGTAAFKGADRAGGVELRPARTYSARARAGGRVELLGPNGRSLATVPAPLRATGPAPLTLLGRSGFGRTDGAYRGALEFRPGALGGVNAINAVAIDDYVQGVVPLESPANWPSEALKAQAVAARTYALTTSKSGAGFEHYPDTRSQVYGGVGAEHPATNTATRATAGQLVTYQGTPVATYFFSTSGGRTEDVENSFGGTPKPWLKSVEDEYDSVSPRHRWGPIRMTRAAAARKLRGLVRGSFRGIKVVQRGRSPRIVAADVVGTGGRTRVSGATLRARFALFDSWAFFRTIGTRRAPAPAPPPAAQPDTGGVPPAASTRAGAGLAGRVFPARAGAKLSVQRRAGRRGWSTVGTARLTRGGRFHVAVSGAGIYRVVHGGHAGDAVRVG